MHYFCTIFSYASFQYNYCYTISIWILLFQLVAGIKLCYVATHRFEFESPDPGKFPVPTKKWNKLWVWLATVHISLMLSYNLMSLNSHSFLSLHYSFLSLPRYTKRIYTRELQHQDFLQTWRDMGHNNILAALKTQCDPTFHLPSKLDQFLICGLAGKPLRSDRNEETQCRGNHGRT